jgi:hypothetical protein
MLDQQIGDRPLPLGRIHRHGCLSGPIFTWMTESLFRRASETNGQHHPLER